LKSCTACKLVKYCSRDCQIAHRPQHKKACKKRAAELYDEQLFKMPPPPEDCPICMLPPPIYNNNTSTTFHSCCGKLICDGCVVSMIYREGVRKLCAFCRTPSPNSGEEEVKRTEMLVDKGNAEAYCTLAGFYCEGIYGLPQDYAKCNELLLKAGELGCAGGYFNLGTSYQLGLGLEIDKKKAKHYWELAAMKGHVHERSKVGAIEGASGNHHRAMKHFIISASSGDSDSLNTLKVGYKSGLVTKDEYANTLREYQKSQDEMKSDMRDKAHNMTILTADRYRIAHLSQPTQP